MCLTVKDFKKPQPKKNGRVNVYKVFQSLNWVNDLTYLKQVKTLRNLKQILKPTYIGLATPYMSVKVNPGWFKADGHKSCVRQGETIGYGAIHCFPSMKKLYASNILSNFHDGVVVKCEALVSDFIANGVNGDVAYRKIYISKKAINVALKKKGHGQ